MDFSENNRKINESPLANSNGTNGARGVLSPSESGTQISAVTNRNRTYSCASRFPQFDSMTLNKMPDLVCTNCKEFSTPQPRPRNQTLNNSFSLNNTSNSNPQPKQLILKEIDFDEENYERATSSHDNKSHNESGSITRAELVRSALPNSLVGRFGRQRSLPENVFCGTASRSSTTPP